MFLRFSAQNTFGNPQYVFKNILSTIFCNRFFEHINSDTKEDEKSRVRNLERCRASKNIFENNILYQLSILYTPNTCVIKIWLLFNSFFYSPSFKTTALGETEIKLNGDITGWYFWQASSNMRVSGEQPVHPWVSSASISDHTAALKISVFT